MKSLLRRCHRIVTDERGLEIIEYALITALIVTVVAAAIITLSAALSGRFGTVQNTVSGIPQ
jgi:Flp pilus assembly pilin Flp